MALGDVDLGIELIQNGLTRGLGLVLGDVILHELVGQTFVGFLAGVLLNGVADDGICCSEGTTREAVLASLKHIVDEDEHAVISLYYGCDVKSDEAEALAAEIESIYEDIDVECKMGGQPVYYYILSAE